MGRVDTRRLWGPAVRHLHVPLQVPAHRSGGRRTTDQGDLREMSRRGATVRARRRLVCAMAIGAGMSCCAGRWSGTWRCRTAGPHKPRGSTRPNRCTSREPVRASSQGEPAGATGSSRWASKLSADDVPHSISRSSVRAAAIFLSRLLFACSLEPVAFTSSLFERLQPAHLVRQQPAITRSSGKQSTGTFADPPYFR